MKRVRLIAWIIHTLRGWPLRYFYLSLFILFFVTIYPSLLFVWNEGSSFSFFFSSGVYTFCMYKYVQYSSKRFFTRWCKQKRVLCTYYIYGFFGVWICLIYNDRSWWTLSQFFFLAIYSALDSNNLVFSNHSLSEFGV